MADQAPLLVSPHHLETAPGPQGGLEVLRQIDAVDAEQVEAGRTARAANPEPPQTALQLGLEGGGIMLGRHFGLKDPIGIRHLAQQPTQLPLRCAVVPCRLKVVKPSSHSGLKGGAQLILAGRGDLIGAQIAPALLKTHAPE